ncbi:hypothetical protein [Litchfieldia salsa]|uniref:hypothetical protein n=1 Tax=Litchfieldia salsa TaxID=930152 RepID=UPI000B8424E1|nr:hypothetical protein [Litchfieldia salsa]
MTDIKNPYVTLQDINVNVIQTNAGIFIGTNRQSYWSTHSKANHGLGSISGNGNKTFRNVNIVIDPDTIDSPSTINQTISGS